jgi:hypothetical protein
VVGSHLSYLWNFNDYTTATGAHVTHEFDLGTGNTFVALTVTDDRGEMAVARVNIAVVGNAQEIPSAQVAASVTLAAPGESVSFDASGSAPALVPVGDKLASYNWDFGDGTPAQTTQAATIAHTFAHAGRYNVTVQAVNQEGVPAQAGVTVAVGGASSAVRSGSGLNWGLIVGLLVLVLLAMGGGILLVRQQRQQAALERQRAAAQELRRARRIPTNGVRPGDPRWGDSRAGTRRARRSTDGGAGQGERSRRPTSNR